jgi:hypothetical protein
MKQDAARSGDSATLSATEISDLREIAGTMIPSDASFGVPGADDPLIMADIVKSLGRDLPSIREAIATILQKAGGSLADLSLEKREALIGDYCAKGGAATMALSRAILFAYYRDDRVLVALRLEARSPFPKGHVLEQGDWSLLDAVRHRRPFWRDDRVGPGVKS